MVEKSSQHIPSLIFYVYKYSYDSTHSKILYCHQENVSVEIFESVGLVKVIEISIKNFDVGKIKASIVKRKSLEPLRNSIF